MTATAAVVEQVELELAGDIDDYPDNSTARADFEITFDTAPGRQLAELKIISCCMSHYKRAGARRARAVEKKARGIPGEYERKITKLVSTLDAADGRVMAKYKSFGDIRCLVGGGYGEFNRDFKRVMRQLAESKTATVMADTPVAGGEALQLQHIRRRVSTVLWRSQSNLLLNGLKMSGPGGAEAYRRRRAGRCAYDDGVAEVRAAWEVEFCRRSPTGTLMQQRRPREAWLLSRN